MITAGSAPGYFSSWASYIGAVQKGFALQFYNEYKFVYIMSDTNLVLFSDSPPANINNKKPLHKKVVFKEYDTGQVEFFPEDLEESIPKFHIARFIKAVINRIVA